jgi:hypothetical protein
MNSCDSPSSSPRSLRRSSPISASGPPQPTARPCGIPVAVFSATGHRRVLTQPSVPDAIGPRTWRRPWLRGRLRSARRRSRAPMFPLDSRRRCARYSALIRTGDSRSPAAGGQRSGWASRHRSDGPVAWPAVRRRARPKRKFLSPNGVAGEEPAHEARESSRAAAEEDVGMVREERPGVDIRVGRQGHVAKPRPPRPWALATLHWPVGDATSGSRNRIPRRRSRTLRRPDSGPAH